MPPDMLLVCIFTSMLATFEQSPAIVATRGKPFQLGAQAELGYAAVLGHHIQLGRNGSQIDYNKDLGQNMLRPFVRLSARVTWRRDHRFNALYQPLNLDTRSVTMRDLIVDDATFSTGRAVDTHYGFDFWRLDYRYQLLQTQRFSLAIGGGLQLRNAVLDFTDSAAGLRRTRQNIGPVPLVTATLRGQLTQSVWAEADVAGFWAPLRYINGSKIDINGAFWDLAVRVGVHAAYEANFFVAVRYLGGGVTGATSSVGFGDGYIQNWLHLLTVSVGAQL